MLKVVNPYVVKIVGATAAMLFQHITYWMQTQKKEIIFRTNQELVLDLEECLSVQQVQRAKKKLIDNGLIEVSFDKVNKWVRTTHYTLTSKGKKMMMKLNNIKANKEENTSISPQGSSQTISNFNDKCVGDSNIHEQAKEYKECRDKARSSKWISKEEYKKMKQQERIDLANNKEPIVPKSMQDSFNEGFKGSKNATTIPEHLLNNPTLAKMLKMKGKHRNKNV